MLKVREQDRVEVKATMPIVIKALEKRPAEKREIVSDLD